MLQNVEAVPMNKRQVRRPGGARVDAADAPDSIGKAILRFIWTLPHVIALPVLLAAGGMLVMFALWSSLPDSTKESVIRRLSTEFEKPEGAISDGPTAKAATRPARSD